MRRPAGQGHGVEAESGDAVVQPGQQIFRHLAGRRPGHGAEFEAHAAAGADGGGEFRQTLFDQAQGFALQTAQVEREADFAGDDGHGMAVGIGEHLSRGKGEIAARGFDLVP